MNKFSQKVELVANILIIVAIVALVGILVQRYFFPVKSTNQFINLQASIGTKVNLPDVDWVRQSKTLILVLESTCRYCNESAPFYRRLTQEIQGKNVSLIAVFPTKVEESRKHLNELGLSSLEVKQASLDMLQVIGTPTVILTNDKGEVTHSWVGKLSVDKELDLISKL